MNDLDVLRLQEQLRGLLRRQRSEAAAVEGLTSTSVRVLAALARREESGSTGTTPGDLATELHMASSNVATSLREVDDAGLIERLQDPGDRRRVSVFLTPEGREAVEAHRWARSEWLRAAIDAELDEAEQAQLLAAGALMERIAAHRGAVTPGS